MTNDYLFIMRYYKDKIVSASCYKIHVLGRITQFLEQFANDAMKINSPPSQTPSSLIFIYVKFLTMKSKTHDPFLLGYPENVPKIHFFNYLSFYLLLTEK